MSNEFIYLLIITYYTIHKVTEKPTYKLTHTHLILFNYNKRYY